jgi:hypothetical protein
LRSNPERYRSTRIIEVVVRPRKFEEAWWSSSKNVDGKTNSKYKRAQKREILHPLPPSIPYSTVRRMNTVQENMSIFGKDNT